MLVSPEAGTVSSVLLVRLRVKPDTTTVSVGVMLAPVGELNSTLYLPGNNLQPLK